jgi:hypothetical protein
MTIQIKNTLNKSRNPTEHKIRLENQVGELIQVVGDGYNLIEFKHIKVKGQTLQWYVHENDFFIKL